jgi:hypothetical protein
VGDLQRQLASHEGAQRCVVLQYLRFTHALLGKPQTGHEIDPVYQVWSRGSFRLGELIAGAAQTLALLEP